MVKKKVLIVDDDEVIREFLLFNLEELGYEVHHASGGVEAVLKIIEEKAVDFVILDLTMPGLSGVNALNKLKRARPELPIAVCTGYLEMEGLDREVTANKAVGCFRKPFSFEKLETLLRIHC